MPIVNILPIKGTGGGVVEFPSKVYFKSYRVG